MQDRIEQEAHGEKMKGLSEQLEAIANSYVADPKMIAEYLQFASKFYSYSPNNAMLIYAQNPAAAFVASFQAWKDQGHMVRRGEKGMKIFVPNPVTLLTGKDGKGKTLKEATKEEKELIKAGKIKTTKKLYFRMGHVFDIAQTNVPFEDYPKILAPGVASVKHAELAKRLKEYIGEHVCKVVDEQPSGARLRGSYSSYENMIRMSPALQDTAYLSTLTHELGHALMHQKTELSTLEKEFQADAFSIMMHKELALEISDERKEHLANTFDGLKNVVEIDSSKDIPEGMKKEDYLASQYRELLVGSLKEVHTTYSEHVPAILEYIKSYEKVVATELITTGQTPTR